MARRKDGGKKWTETDIAFLQGMLGKMTIREIAQALSRTYKSVEGKLGQLRAPRVANGCTWKKEARGKVAFSYVKRVRKRAKHSGFDGSVVNGSASNMAYLDSLAQPHCGLSGRILVYHANKRDRDANASLDRIDSSIGYIQGNVRWLDKDVNKMKLDMSDDEFLSFVRDIANHSLGMSEKRDDEHLG